MRDKEYAFAQGSPAERDGIAIIRQVAATVPGFYSTVEEEYFALKNGAGLSDLSAWTKLRFSGGDRKAFLQGLLSNDVAALKPGERLRCCLLTPKGKLSADLELYDEGETMLALARPAAGAPLRAALAKYLPLSETTMEDVGESCLFQAAGPEALKTLGPFLGAMSPAPGISRIQWRDAAVSVLVPPWIGGVGALLLIQKNVAGELWDELLASGQAFGLKPVGAAALTAWRVEKGLPLYGTDMNSETIPQEARLEDSISFTKGCYMGQETMSRLKHLGHVNRILTLLQISGADLPPEGSEVLAGQEVVGRITSSVWSFSHGAVLALGLIRLAESQPDVRVSVRSGESKREALVLAYPAGT